MPLKISIETDEHAQIISNNPTKTDIDTPSNVINNNEIHAEVGSNEDSNMVHITEDTKLKKRTYEEIRDLIIELLGRRRRSQSTTAVMDALGLARSTAKSHLNHLEKEGLLNHFTIPMREGIIECRWRLNKSEMPTLQ